MPSFNGQVGANSNRCRHRGKLILSPLCLLVVALTVLPSRDSMAEATELDDQSRSQDRKRPSGGEIEKQKPAELLDVNSASEEDLAKLPGIGPELARRIVAFRRKHGPFRRVEDLLAIRGLGHKKWREIRWRVMAGSESRAGDHGGEGEQTRETGSREQ